MLHRSQTKLVKARGSHCMFFVDNTMKTFAMATKTLLIRNQARDGLIGGTGPRVPQKPAKVGKGKCFALHVFLNNSIKIFAMATKTPVIRNFATDGVIDSPGPRVV